MARRIHGDVLVAPRPNGGAVITLRSATGEAIEIERNADQIAALRKEIAAIAPTQEPDDPAAEAAPAKRARSKKNA
jgi:hypothetical protein